MSKNEILKDFMNNTVIPGSIVLALGIVLSPLCKVGESVDFGVLFVYCSFPFGIYMILKKFPIDKNMKTFAKVVTAILAVIVGCALGVAALAWTLGRAFGYIPYTLWRFVMKDELEGSGGLGNEDSSGCPHDYANSYGNENRCINDNRCVNENNCVNENSCGNKNIYGVIEDPILDADRIEVMKRIQELSEKRK
ncbi:hypothetical protein SAMN02745248_02141 [Hathewaya proteolytica DSM 3090]|uniref:Uncharacterized protein n=1 Tax=Hathewaya proteolytica DSM 3090 TaxID=1121331 RepID=A0A1M6QX18_9CLOT|nr:DUF6050 family protein [Hathewaya proteolytica]SHK24745.1 hypothetical protein SAMN02745248_02141 [Hathewaya proteolytica DSM 3090]